MNILTTGFETTPIAMEPMWQIAFQAPSDDVEFAGFLVREGIDSVSLNPDAVLRAWAVVAAAEREAGKDG